MVGALALCASLVASGPSFKVGMVGHSLVNHDLPQMLRTIAAGKGKNLVVYEQVINGSPLRVNWQESSKAEKHPENLYGDLRSELAKASPPFDVVILTERVAIAECIKWEDTQGYVIQWRNLALKRQPKARVMLYSTWVGTKDGEWWKDVPDLPTWRRRTEADGKLFAQVARAVNGDRRSSPGAPVSLAPGHAAMGLLSDELEAGRLPWLGKNIRAVLSDNIHLNSKGNYAIACTLYASLFGESPEGAPGAVKDIWGRPLVSLTAQQAGQLQKLAWKAVSNYRAKERLR